MLLLKTFSGQPARTTLEMLVDTKVAFNGDVGDVVARRDHRGVVVSVPVALHGKDIVGSSNEAIAHDGVTAAEPVHTVLVRIRGIAADQLDVLECDSSESSI